MPAYIEGFNPGGNVIAMRWGDFLALVTAKGLAMQYTTGTDTYQIWAVDGPDTYMIAAPGLVFSGSSANYPFPLPDGYTAAQNNTDVATFTGTYQAGANTVALSNIGAIAATAPLSAGFIGGVNGGGLLRGISASLANAAPTSGMYGLGTNDASNGSASGGTAASVSGLVGGIYNSTPPTLTNGQQSSLQLDASGNLKISGTITASNPSVGTVGSTAPTSATQIAGDSTAGNLIVPGVTLASTAAVATQQALVTAFSPNSPLPTGSNVIGAVTQSGSWSVTVTGTVAVTQSTSPWVTSDLADGSVTGGTAGTKSMLGGLVYNSTAPALTTGQQVALQGDAKGNLLVNRLDNVNLAQSIAATSTTNAVTLALAQGCATVGVEVTGTWTGTLIFEANSDGSTWFPINGVVATTGAIVGTTTANGEWLLPVAGYQAVRVRVSVAGTGTAVISLDGSWGSVVHLLGAPLPTGSNVIGAVNQGTSPWVVSGTVTASNPSVGTVGATAPTSATQVGGDSTAGNLIVAGVTLASTAAVATQQALVVALSPATPLPAGTNALGSVTVTGTVAVTQSTTPWVTSDLADGAVANGAAGTKSMLGGLIYLSAAPTLTTGNQNSLLGDVNGNLLVNLKTALPAGSNVIGAVTQSGTWTVQQGTPPWTITGTGTAGTPATGVVTIQGISGGTAVPVSGTVAVTQSTSPWVTSDLADGAVSGGTAGTKSMLAGLVYNTADLALTNGQQASLQGDVLGNLKVTNADGWRASYLASKFSLTVAATPTDVFTIQGSATKTIRITRVSISGIQSSGGTALFRFIVRSAANTGGTSTTITAVPNDSGDSAGTAVVKAYTVNPTALGAAVGDVQDVQLYIPGSLASEVSSPFNITFGNLAGTKALVLRGTSQFLALNMNGVTMSGSSLNITIEWTEE